MEFWLAYEKPKQETVRRYRKSVWKVSKSKIVIARRLVNLKQACCELRTAAKNQAVREVAKKIEKMILKICQNRMSAVLSGVRARMCMSLTRASCCLTRDERKQPAGESLKIADNGFWITYRHVDHANSDE